MIQAHLATNGYPCLIILDNVVFAEEMNGTDENENEIHFTRVFLKRPLPTDKDSPFIDISEKIDVLIKQINCKKDGLGL